MASRLLGNRMDGQDRARADIESRLQQLEARSQDTLDSLSGALSAIRTPNGVATTGVKVQDVSRNVAKSAEAALTVARDRLAEIDQEAIRLKAIERANQLGTGGSARASDLAKRFGERTNDLIEETRAHAPEWKSRVASSLEDALDKRQIVEERTRETSQQVKERVAKAAERASGLASEAQAGIPARLGVPPERRGVGPIRIGRKRQPTGLALLAAKAQEHGPALVESVRESLAASQGKAQPMAIDAADVVNRWVKKVREQSSHATHDLVPRATDAVHHAQERGEHAAAELSAKSHDVAHRVSHTASAVPVKSREAAVAAGQGGKDLGGLMLWTSAAAGVAFYAFLNDRQRARVKAAGKRIFGEVKSVVSELRGVDGQFS